ncbi:hypothetical protein ACQ4LE_005672 [Meloidogyne hapla]|uniref:glutathione transferase n=1 Tax=Meloidogyne hapla TaxID=6305 RepID=A0A1I8BCS1_MELHA
MVQYKLHYFDVGGKGESIRLLFNYKGQPFEDIRIKKNEWPKIKSKFIFGQVPVLEVDGKQLAQSGAIMQFLGKKFGLAGKNEWEEAKADEINHLYDEMANIITPYIGAKVGLYSGDLEKLHKNLFLPAMDKYLPLFDKLLKDSNSGYLLPSGLSFVDFSVAHFIGILSKMEPEIISKYPKLIEFSNNFHSLPQLKDYIIKRKI